MKAFYYRTLDALKSSLGVHTRFGLSANYGTIERLGFVTPTHAKEYALRAGYDNWVPFEYDQRQRLTPALHYSSSRPAPRGGR